MFKDLGQDISAWVHAIDAAEIPVLQRTNDELARLRENEERVGPRDIARVLLHDPMFTLRVLRYLEAHRRRAQVTDITTVEHALMMLGVTPFFAHFRELPAVETILGEAALGGLMRVVNRSHHAALYSFDWAVLRHDSRADEVAMTALLHDLAEMLLWCFAPERALRIDAMLRADRKLRSSAAQTAVLGFKLGSLQAALIDEWKLAAMRQKLLDDSRATHSRAANVALAVNLARHSASGWDNPALPDDFEAIRQYLKLPRDEVLGRIRHVAVQGAAAVGWYHLEAAPIPENLDAAFGAQDCAGSDDT